MKKIVSLILVLILIFIVGCDNQGTGKTNEEIEAGVSAEVEEEQGPKGLITEPENEEEKTNDINDTQAVIEFVNTTDMNKSEVEIKDDHEVQYLDFTGEGNDDVVIVNRSVNGRLDPVALVTTDVWEGEYYLFNTSMHGQIGDEFFYEDGFIVKKYTSYGATRSQLYYNTGDEYIDPRMDWIVGEGTSDYIEDVKLGTKTIVEESITKKDGFKNFIWQSNSFYIDEFGERHLLEKATREFTFNEEGMHFDLDEKVETIYPSILDLRKDIVCYGNDTSFKTFETVYDEGDLLSALQYYNENRYDFTKKAKEQYVLDTIEVLENGITSNDYYIDYPAENIIEDTIEITLKGNPIEEKAQSVFKMAKRYYAMEGGLSEEGYSIAITDVDTAKLVHIIYTDWLLFAEGEDVYYYPSNHDTYADIEFTNIEEVLNYQDAYPTVIVGSISDLEELKHEDVWKTTVLLPVKIK